MFAALELAECGFFKRRQLNRKPQVREVRVPGGLPFTLIRTAFVHGRVDSEAVSTAAGNYSRRMLLPERAGDIAGTERFDSSRFRKLVLFNTAAYILRQSLDCGERLSLCVADRSGVLAGKLSHVVPLVSDVRVMTDNRAAYNEDIAGAMEEFGAAVRFCEKADADIVIDLDSSGADGRVIFSFEKGFSFFGAELPICYASLKPAGIDTLDFAAALFELCRISTLGDLRGAELTLNSRPCTYRRAEELTRDLLQPVTIDNPG